MFSYSVYTRLPTERSRVSTDSHHHRRVGGGGSGGLTPPSTMGCDATRRDATPRCILRDALQHRVILPQATTWPRVYAATTSTNPPNYQSNVKLGLCHCAINDISSSFPSGKHAGAAGVPYIAFLEFVCLYALWVCRIHSLIH